MIWKSKFYSFATDLKYLCPQPVSLLQVRTFSVFCRYFFILLPFTFRNWNWWCAFL